MNYKTEPILPDHRAARIVLPKGLLPAEEHKIRRTAGTAYRAAVNAEARCRALEKIVAAQNERLNLLESRMVGLLNGQRGDP